jgi:DNA-directed RNA polymerase specialized sigma24 family protein
MLTAQEIGDRFGMSVANVRKYASRRSIRAVRGHYDPDLFEERATA